eukprot:ANDGO_08174.mRNA.1 hypothetical protein
MVQEEVTYDSASSGYFITSVVGLTLWVIIFAVSFIVKYTNSSQSGHVEDNDGGGCNDDDDDDDRDAALPFRTRIKGAAKTMGRSGTTRERIPFVASCLLFSTGLDFLYFSSATNTPLPFCLMTRTQKFFTTMFRSLPIIVNLFTFLQAFVQAGQNENFETTFTVFAAAVVVFMFAEWYFLAQCLANYVFLWDLFTTKLPTEDRSLRAEVQKHWRWFSTFVITFSIVTFSVFVIYLLDPVSTFQFRVVTWLLSLLFFFALTTSVSLAIVVAGFTTVHLLIMQDMFLRSIGNSAPAELRLSQPGKAVTVSEAIEAFFDCNNALQSTSSLLHSYFGLVFVQVILTFSLLVFFLSEGFAVNNVGDLVAIFGPLISYTCVLTVAAWSCAVANGYSTRFIELVSTVIAVEGLPVSKDEKWSILRFSRAITRSPLAAAYEEQRKSTKSENWNLYVSHILDAEDKTMRRRPHPPLRSEQSRDAANSDSLLSDTDKVRMHAFLAHLKVRSPQIRILGIILDEGTVVRSSYAIFGLTMFFLQRAVSGGASTL